jgi:hypothetical protein
MNDSPPASASVPSPFVVWIIWGALVVSVLVYGGIGLALAPAPDPAEQPPEDAASAMVPVLAVVAVGALAASFVLRVVFLSRLGQGRKPDGADPAAFGKFLTLHVVLFALAESVAIHGLVLRFAAGISNGLFLAFLGAALFGLACHAPLGAPLPGRRA